MGRKLSVLGLLVALLLMATPVLAGGWAVITVDSLPGEVRAGETLSIGFMLRQHGQTPTNSASPTLSAINLDTGERITADARQSGETGHYLVDVVFPSEGQWEWSLSGFGPAVNYEPLTVLPATAMVADASQATVVFPVREALRWTALALMLVAGLMATLAMRERDITSAPAAGD